MRWRRCGARGWQGPGRGEPGRAGHGRRGRAARRLGEGQPQRARGLGYAGSGGAGQGCAVRGSEGPWKGTAAVMGHSELVGLWDSRCGEC